VHSNRIGKAHLLTEYCIIGLSLKDVPKYTKIYAQRYLLYLERVETVIYVLQNERTAQLIMTLSWELHTVQEHDQSGLLSPEPGWWDQARALGSGHR
jgi:hypothetical protein